MGKKLYLCDPAKNPTCRKTGCFKTGGPCFHTDKEASASTCLFADDDLVITHDAIQKMLDMQKGFQDRVDPRYKSDDPAVRADFIRDHWTHCVQELGELLQEVPYYKNWKDYSKMTPEEMQAKYVLAQEELIDAWHFFMNIALALGMDAETFVATYMGKHKENIRRQDEGYDHTMNHLHGGESNG